MSGRLCRIDEERMERLHIETTRAERIRDYVPEEEFDEATARIIARSELEGRMARYQDNGQ